MRRRRVELLPTLAIAFVVGSVFFLLVSYFTIPWVSSPIAGACGLHAGLAVGFPLPFFWQGYGLPLAAGESTCPPVWDAAAFAFDYTVWFLAALVLVSLPDWPSAPRRPSISSSGILPPLASSSDDIGLTPRQDGSPARSRDGEPTKRKAQE